jgi:hypothetical protein
MRYSKVESENSVFLNPSKHSAEYMVAYSELDEVVNAGLVIVTSPSRVVNMANSRVVSCLQLFTFLELLNCAFRSVSFYIKLVPISDDPLFRLHLVRVWRASINCMLMDKLREFNVGVVVHDNHYDTNAVIIHQMFKGRIVLIQHGQVRSDTVPPCRIRPPSKLYVLDEGAEKIFRSCVFSSTGAQIEVASYSKRLVFVETECEGFIILIASRPGDVEAEMQFISSLRFRGLEDVKIIVKPHPLMSDRLVYPRRFLSENRVSVWKPRYCYPRPTLLVCGRSTMRTEFEAYRIPVLNVHESNVVETTCNLHTEMMRRKSESVDLKEGDE